MSPAAGTGRRSRRGLVGVLAAQAVAWTGTRLSAIALPWFVLSSTGSVTQTGLVVFAEMGPYVLVQALAGPLIDRRGPRRISVTCDLVAATAMAMVPLLYLAGALQMWVLLALVAVTGAADGPANAAKSVFIPAVTRAAGVPLERATGLAGALERLAGVVGPAIAGLLVAAVGGAGALWVTAGMFGAGAAIIALAVPAERRGVGRTAAEAGGYLAQLREGGRFLHQDRLLRAIVGMVAVTNLLDAALFSVALPVWARELGHGPIAIGLVASILGGFSIVASLVSAMVGHRLPRRTVYLVGFLVGGAPRFAVLALGGPLWLVLAVHAVAGLGLGFVNPTIAAVQFERIPAHLLGRLKTLSQALAWSGIPLGGLAGGALIGLTGLAPALLLFGGCYLIATTLPGLQRDWAELNRPARDREEPDLADQDQEARA